MSAAHGALLRATITAFTCENGVELRGFEPLTPSMRTRCATGLRYSPAESGLRTAPTLAGDHEPPNRVRAAAGAPPVWRASGVARSP